MSTPKDLRFTDSHEWVRDNGDGTVTIGITDYAQAQLGDVVFWDGPKKGAALSRGKAVGTVESVKAVSDVYTPLSGEVVESNPGLDGAPDAVNSDPYGEGWMVRLRPSDPGELEGLMDGSAYEAYLGGLG